MRADRFRTTRRGALALAAGTALAGCSLLRDSSAPGPQLDGERLTEITTGALPSVSRTVPVSIAAEHLRGHVDRTEALLDSVPSPLNQREIPNGAMREELNDTAEAARTSIDRARGAASPFEALGDLRDARADARAVATGWAYADEGLRRTDLAAESDALTDAIESFRDRWSYVGDDPVRALLVHRSAEQLVSVAADSADGRSRRSRVASRPENLVTVSEDAAALERGRAALADATHLYDRLREDLSSSRDLEDRFLDAVEVLQTSLRSETTGYSADGSYSEHVDADVEGSPVRYPLEFLYSDLVRGASITDYRNRGDLAGAIVSIHREYARVRAFDDLCERVEGGESFAVESAEDVATRRETAVSAVETALAETTRPALSRTELHDVVGLVGRTDDELGPFDEGEQVSVRRVEREVGDYIYAAAVARGTPEASEVVASALVP